jgi:hypothetical protein
VGEVLDPLIQLNIAGGSETLPGNDKTTYDQSADSPTRQDISRAVKPEANDGTRLLALSLCQQTVLLRFLVLAPIAHQTTEYFIEHVVDVHSLAFATFWIPTQIEGYS